MVAPWQQGDDSGGGDGGDWGHLVRGIVEDARVIVQGAWHATHNVEEVLRVAQQVADLMERPHAASRLMRDAETSWPLLRDDLRDALRDARWVVCAGVDGSSPEKWRNVPRDAVRVAADRPVQLLREQGSGLNWNGFRLSSKHSMKQPPIAASRQALHSADSCQTNTPPPQISLNTHTAAVENTRTMGWTDEARISPSPPCTARTRGPVPAPPLPLLGEGEDGGGGGGGVGGEREVGAG
uniref:Uncharacterized protein n=1 Tax=Oryza meridionalis TaxID=40149 RepID=A0A0E0E1D4_9ORYZ